MFTALLFIPLAVLVTYLAIGGLKFFYYIATMMYIDSKGRELKWPVEPWNFKDFLNTMFLLVFYWKSYAARVELDHLHQRLQMVQLLHRSKV